MYLVFSCISLQQRGNHCETATKRNFFFISIGPRGSVEVLNFSVKIQMWCEAGICSGVALSTRTGVILQTSHLTIAEHKELP